MPHPDTRRALYVVSFATLAMVVIVAAGLGAKPSATQGAAPTEAAPAPEPQWAQLMGRSVQARKAGAVREAELLLQQAEDVAAGFALSDIRRAETRLGQAEYYLWSGDVARAEQAYKEAVSLGESATSAKDPGMINLLEGLANFYFYRERYDEAAPLLDRILQIVRGATPHDPHEEARRLRSLAQVHQLRGRYAEAVPHLQLALRLIEASPRRSPGETAEYLQASAECYRAWGRASLAEPLAARALELIEGVAGPNTLDVVPYLKTLAEARVESGRSNGAIVLFERAIAITERNSGAGHSDLAPFLMGLSAALRSQGKIAEANAYSARAKSVAGASLGPKAVALQDAPAPTATISGQ